MNKCKMTQRMMPNGMREREKVINKERKKEKENESTEVEIKTEKEI